jgi:hypothetical protein
MNPDMTEASAAFPPTPLAAPQDRMPPTKSAVVNGPANGPGNFLPPLFNLSGLDLPSVSLCLRSNIIRTTWAIHPASHSIH